MRKGEGTGRFGKYKLVRGIYKITNKFTGNCYIGKSADVEFRLTRHRQKIYGGYRDYPVWAKDIQMYGVDSFEYELLEEIEDKNEVRLAFAELKWCQKIRPQYNKGMPVISWNIWNKWKTRELQGD